MVGKGLIVKPESINSAIMILHDIGENLHMDLSTENVCNCYCRGTRVISDKLYPSQASQF